MTTITNKEKILPGLLTPERLEREFSFHTFPVGFCPRYKTYKKSDGTYYVVAGLTLLNKRSGVFIRPRGEGASEMLALKNTLINLANLVLDIGEHCDDVNMKISQSYEY
jgi:hypothetical protein